MRNSLAFRRNFIKTAGAVAAAEILRGAVAVGLR
jgi:hypothetical protein